MLLRRKGVVLASSTPKLLSGGRGDQLVGWQPAAFPRDVVAGVIDLLFAMRRGPYSSRSR